MNDDANAAEPQTNATHNKIGWVLQGVVALGFTFPFGGVPKLLGDPYTKDLFAQVTSDLSEGLADPTRYAVGVTELAVAVLILLPATRVYGAVLGVLAMLGAIGGHLATPLGVMPTLTDAATGESIESPVIVAAGVLLLLSATVVFFRRAELPIGSGK